MTHTCHWPGCTKEVPPKLWGCAFHWFKLPKVLRDGIYKYYVPGQEITKTPTIEYLRMARLVQGWIEGKVKINKDGSIEVLEDLKLWL